jgi:Serine dehydrogenase proteinase
MSMKERRVRNQFPRVDQSTTQSSKYWAKEKDRYIRQLLISDIENITERELIVYFCRTDQAITETDAEDIAEILEGVDSKEIDILLYTVGGLIDAVEKIVSLLNLLEMKYRVVVPSLAKSGGTLIALSAEQILMGITSDLGPVDPQMTTSEHPSVPAEFIIADENQSAILRSFAKANIERARALAQRYLRTIFRPKGADPSDDEVQAAEARFQNALSKLCSAEGYFSHGAVIDFHEATALGLPVTWMPPESNLWQRIWLLYCLYDFDTQRENIGKIVEGAIYSISRPPIIWE